MIYVSALGHLAAGNTQAVVPDEHQKFWWRTKDVAIGSLTRAQKQVQQRLARDAKLHCVAVSSMVAFDVTIELKDGRVVVHRVHASTQLHARRAASARERLTMKRVVWVRAAVEQQHAMAAQANC